MLVLSRSQDSAIQIGADVTITVLGIHKGRVKLGINAPSAISVRREEDSLRFRHGQTHAAVRAPRPTTADATP